MLGKIEQACVRHVGRAQIRQQASEKDVVRGGVYTQHATWGCFVSEGDFSAFYMSRVALSDHRRLPFALWKSAPDGSKLSEIRTLDLVSLVRDMFGLVDGHGPGMPLAEIAHAQCLPTPQELAPEAAARG